MNSLARFVAQRLALLVLTLFAVSVLIFTITQLLPGDVATMILGMQATPQDLATLRTQLGLDQPALVQFWRWLGGVLHGDLGMSTRFHRPVVEVLAPPLEKSLILGLAGMAFAVPMGLALGLLCALRRDSLLDVTVSSVTMFAAAMPEFVTGGLLIIVFSTWLGWLPPFAGTGSARTVVQSVTELILPVLALSFVILAYIQRMMRASVSEVLDSAFVQAALLKGLDRRRVIVAHVLPGALGPTLSVIALSIGWMAGGLVIVESLFGYPGIGRMLVFAIRNRDVPLLQAISLVVAAVYALANLAADVGQRALDPAGGVVGMTGPVASAAGHVALDKPEGRRWRWQMVVPAAVVAVYLLTGLVGESVAPYSATDFNTGPPLAPPSETHLFGTDGFGRDVFSRVLVGARTILLLSLSATLLGVGAGCALGLVSGYRGGAVDETVMRLVDVLLALPGLLLAMLILTSLGPSSLNLVLAIGFVFIPKSARIARSAVLPLRNAGYVEAARLRGAGWASIVFAELLPIVLPQLAVEFCLRFAYALLLISSLGFLGFGVQPPTPDWGLMISEARNYVTIAPWPVLFPALAIGLLVVAVNALADALTSSGERRVEQYL